jgi:hypothetical protein
MPDAIHIATEGPLGSAARRYCIERDLCFTTAYHTKYPEYPRARFGVPMAQTYAMLRRFHHPSSTVTVATETVRRELAGQGFKPLAPVGAKRTPAARFEAPLHNVHFAGCQEGETLVRHYAAADVFVLPSRTETFGLVLLEALACGLPIAALPVPGPLDVIGGSGVGVLDWDLRAAALAALKIPPENCRSHAERFSWRVSVEQFLRNAVTVQGPKLAEGCQGVVPK